MSGTTRGERNYRGSQAAERLYKFTLSSRASVTMDSTKSVIPTTLRVYSGGSPHFMDPAKEPLSQLHAACVDHQGAGCDYSGGKTRARLTTILGAGNYFILVESSAGTLTGSFTITLSCDKGSFAGSMKCGDRVTGSITGAKTVVTGTRKDGEPSTPQRIYDMHIDRPMSLKIDSCGSDVDTYMRLMTVDLKTTLSECDDCGDCDSSTVLSVGVCSGSKLLPGDYAIVLEGYDNEDGPKGTKNFNLFLDCTSQCSCNKPASTSGFPKGLKAYTSFEEPPRRRGQAYKPYIDLERNASHYLAPHVNQNPVTYTSGTFNGAVELGFTVYCDHCNLRNNGKGQMIGVVGSMETCSGANDFNKKVAPHGVQVWPCHL